MRAGGAAAAGLRQLPAAHKWDDGEVLGRADLKRSHPATVMKLMRHADTYSLQRFMMPPFFLALRVLLADSDRGSISHDRL